MRTILLSTLVTIGLTGAAFANPDANGDGVLTLDEVNAAYPEIEADAFAAMDVNGDGVLEAAEVTAAQEAGLLPQS